VQTVLGLIPDSGLRAVEDLGRDLLAGVRRQTVQDDGAVFGGAEQIGIDPEGIEVGAAPFGLLLVAHADPDIGVDRIGAGDCEARVLGQPDAMALLQLVAIRCGDRQLDVGELAGDRQRAGDVVAVADIGEAQAMQVAAALTQGEQVGQSLAGMVARSERVDHRHVGLGSQLGDRVVRAGADHDRIEIAGEDAPGVTDRLAAGELQLVPTQDDRRRPQLGDANLEGDPRPGRGLLEDEGDAAAGQGSDRGAFLTYSVRNAPRGAGSLQLGGKFEQLSELEGPQLLAGDEVPLGQAADTTAVELTAISWNLFHGRDFPPDPELLTWRSRLLRLTERNESHLQVNRDLLPEFTHLLAGAEWDVALLQECPPRWWNRLATACEADAHGVLTSRNSLSPLRTLAARLNPDLIASGEGGSNLTLVRSGGIVERRELTIHEGRPERRAMALTRVAAEGDGGELCLANLHATNDRPELASEDVRRAAQAAGEWAGGAPLIFGGDLNLRPAEDPAVFDELDERFGLAAPTAPAAIDHLLARGLEAVDPPRQWPAAQREVSEGGRALRLSDHTPVEARFATPTPR
jgi:endonuclease/exonuclease/phosphatase family metal-dependent hydrolase